MVAFRLFLYILGNIEVYYDNFLRISDHDVCWFQISVTHSILMQMLQGYQDLPKNTPSLTLSHRAILSQVVRQLHARHILDDLVNGVLEVIFEVLNSTDNVGVFKTTDNLEFPLMS